MEKEQIEFSEFLDIADKLEIRIGEVANAERIPKSDKLLKLSVFFGAGIGLKPCVTNLGAYSEPEVFIGARMPFIMNLKPSKMMGVESEVMIMVAEDDIDGIVDYDMKNYLLGSILL